MEHTHTLYTYRYIFIGIATVYTYIYIGIHMHILNGLIFSQFSMTYHKKQSQKDRKEAVSYRQRHKWWLLIPDCNREFLTIVMSFSDFPPSVLCVRDKASYFAYRLYNAIHVSIFIIWKSSLTILLFIMWSSL